MVACVYGYPIAEHSFRFLQVEHVQMLRAMGRPEYNFFLKKEGVGWRSTRELYGKGSVKRKRNGKVNRLVP